MYLENRESSYHDYVISKKNEDKWNKLNYYSKDYIEVLLSEKIHIIPNANPLVL